MAAAVHSILELDSVSENNSTTLTTRATLAAATLTGAGFANNDEVIVFIWFLGSSVNAGTEQAWRVQYNGSTITPANNPEYDYGVTGNPTTGPSRHGAWVARVNLGTVADFTLQNARVGTSANVAIQKARIAVIRLSDFGTENTDWFWNKSTTDVAHTNSYSATNRAAVTWTPGSVEDWIVFWGIAGIIDNTSDNYEAELTLDGSLRKGDFSQEGESTTEEWASVGMDFLDDLSTSSHTLAVQSRDDSVTTANDHDESFIFVFRKAKWADLYVDVPADGNVNQDADVQIATITNTLTTSQDLLIFGQCKIVVNSPLGAGYPAWMWVEDGTTTIDPNTDWDSDTSTTNGAGIKVINQNTYDTTDELWCYWQGEMLADSGTMNYDLYLHTWGENNNSPATNRMFLVWGMELATSATPATVTPGVIARSAAVPSVTVKGAAKTLPAVTAGTGAVPQVTSKGGAKTLPAVTSRSAAIPAATVKGGAVLTPGVIGRSVVIPQATGADSGSPRTVTPDVIARTALINAVTVQGFARTTPDVIGRVVSVHQVTVQGGAVTAPTVTARSATLPTPTVSGSAKTTPGVISRSATLPSITLKTGATVTPAAIATSATLPQVLLQTAARVQPDTIILVVQIPQAVGDETDQAPSGTVQDGELLLLIVEGALAASGASGAQTISNASGRLTVGSQS